MAVSFITTHEIKTMGVMITHNSYARFVLFHGVRFVTIHLE